MLELFHRSSFTCSRKVTEIYSTSFTLGIKALDKKYHDAIYGIYGFVRYADEIVDTFHDWDKQELFHRFSADTWRAIEEGISLNPILHAFQLTVKKYDIDHSLIRSFLKSMEMDLSMQNYQDDNYREYIYGSAEVVGLMCLQVFCEGNKDLFLTLKSPARSLGAAFQKVNFLRDMQSDFTERGRVYFPSVDFNNFCGGQKAVIEKEIKKDFEDAFEGIKRLPAEAKFGVYLAYKYYLKLFKKIQKTEAARVMQTRIRVSNPGKITMWASVYLQSSVFGIYAP